MKSLKQTHWILLIFVVSVKSGLPVAVTKSSYIEFQSIEKSNVSGHKKNINYLSTYFPVATIIALLYEKYWFIPTKNFDKFLNTRSENISSKAAQMTEQIFLDPNVRVTSTIYTEDKWIFPSPRIEKLNAKIERITLHYFGEQNSQTAEHINDHIKNVTFEEINNFIPSGSRFGPTFTPATTAVFTSTFAFQGEWDVKWTAAGKKTFSSFRETKEQFIETEGIFNFIVTTEEFGISIPLKDSRKSLIFIKPKKHNGAKGEIIEKNLIQSLKRLQENKKFFKISIPTFKYTFYNNFYGEMKRAGVKVCDLKLKKGQAMDLNFIQPIFQESFGQLNSTHFKMASATGTQINHLKKYIAYVKSSFITLGAMSFDEEPTIFEDDSSLRQSIKKVPMGKSLLSTIEQPKVYNSSIVNFDGPFAWILFDPRAGPISIGGIMTFEGNSSKVKTSIDPEVEEYFSWILNRNKIPRWFCPINL